MLYSEIIFLVSSCRIYWGSNLLLNASEMDAWVERVFNQILIANSSMYVGQMSGTQGVNAAVHVSVVMDSLVCTVMF